MSRFAPRTPAPKVSSPVRQQAPAPSALQFAPPPRRSASAGRAPSALSYLDRLVEADRLRREASSAATAPAQVTASTPVGVAQPRLPVGPADSPAEREAERTAERFAAAVDGRSTPPAGDGGALPQALRAQAEDFFGHDLGHVRIHTGTAADRDARRLHANAFTRGDDISFRAGRYDPHSRDGATLLGHELTHVLQQDGATATVQRDPPRPGEDLLDPNGESLQVETAGAEVVLTLLGTFPVHRVRVRREGGVPRRDLDFSAELHAADLRAGRPYASLRIVAAPGVELIPEGWPEGLHAATAFEPALEVRRVQNPTALAPGAPPALEPTTPYVVPAVADGDFGGRFDGGFVVAPGDAGVDIVHAATGVAVHVETHNLSGRDRFAFQVIPAEGTRPPEVQIVRAGATEVRVRAPPGVMPVLVRVWQVSRVEEVPPQGAPFRPVGTEASAIPAEVEYSNEQLIARALLPIFASLTPGLGPLYLAGDLYAARTTGRDLMGNPADETTRDLQSVALVLSAVQMLLRIGNARAVQAALRQAAEQLSRGARLGFRNSYRGATLAAMLEGTGEVIRPIQNAGSPGRNMPSITQVLGGTGQGAARVEAPVVQMVRAPGAAVRAESAAASADAASVRVPTQGRSALQLLDLARWLARGVGISAFGSRATSMSARPRSPSALVGQQGWGGFNLSESMRYADARGALTMEDRERVRAVSRLTRVEAEGEFHPTIWRDLAPARRFAAVRGLIDRLVREMGVPGHRAPRVGRLTSNTDAGEANWLLTETRGYININLSQDEVGEVIATIVHECRHYFQMWQGYQNLTLGVPFDRLHPSTSLWSTNNAAFNPVPGAYLPPGHPGYYKQPVEVDAENFARFVLELLERHFRR